MYFVFFVYFKGTPILICCPWDTTWNNFFHLLLENTSDCPKQHNQHFWLFDPLGPSMSSGYIATASKLLVSLERPGFTTKSLSWARTCLPHCVWLQWKAYSPRTARKQLDLYTSSTTYSTGQVFYSLFQWLPLITGTQQSTEIEFASKLISMEAFSFSLQFPSVR